MAQYEMNLRDYQRVLRKRYKIILMSAVLVAGFSWILAQQVVPIYQAKTSLELEEVGTVSDLLVQSMVTYSVWDHIATQTMVIQSLPVMQRVAAQLGRDKSDAEVLQGKVTVKQVGSTNVIEIFVMSSNPEEARKIANVTAKVYDEYSDSLMKATVKGAKQFIGEQLRECQNRLQAAEDSLKTFQSQNTIPTMEAEASFGLSRLSELETEKNRIDAEVSHLTSQLAALEGKGRLVDYRLGMVQRGNGSGTAVADSGGRDPYAGVSSALAAELMTLKFQRADLLRDYTESHPEVITLDKKIGEVQDAIRAESKERLKLLQGQRDTLIVAYNTQKERVMKLPNLQLTYKGLLREVDANASLYETLQQKYYEMMIKEADMADEVKILSEAKTPTDPINRDAKGKIAAGVAIGLILGLVLAFVKESLDTSLGTLEDMEEYLGVPVLALIPRIDMKEQVQKALALNPALADYPNPERQAQLVAQLDSTSVFAESYRILRTHLQYTSVDKAYKVIVVTSSWPGEGKTITVSNLAIVLAQAAKRTLLVECDLRRPAIYAAFGIDREPGVISIVLGEIDWHDCIKGVTDLMMGRLGMEGIMAQPGGLDHLHIITCGGASPPQPAEMLATERMRRFVEEARGEYDFVLIDAPPVLPVTDATVLSGFADGVILVYQAGRRRADLKLAKIRLEGTTSKSRSFAERKELAESTRSHVLGVILNDVRAETVGYSLPQKQYYYYSESSPKEGTFRRLIDSAKETAMGTVTALRNKVHLS